MPPEVLKERRARSEADVRLFCANGHPLGAVHSCILLAQATPGLPTSFESATSNLRGRALTLQCAAKLGREGTRTGDVVTNTSLPELVLRTIFLVESRQTKVTKGIALPAGGCWTPPQPGLTKCLAGRATEQLVDLIAAIAILLLRLEGS